MLLFSAFDLEKDGLLSFHNLSKGFASLNLVPRVYFSYDDFMVWTLNVNEMST